MIRLSIIIPMYNVEPYVERCIRTLENQDIPKEDYEIICVNDGSPDNSRAVVEKLQKEFTNIVLINQENQGVSMARNNGISKATGQYLLFIDPDDYVDENSFARILENVKVHDVDVSFLGFTVLDVDGNEKHKIYNKELKDQVYKGTQAYFLARGDGQTDPDRMWAVLYKLDFINKKNLKFLPNVPYLEDGELIARILCVAERCIFDGHSFYQRTTRPGSATNSNLYFSDKAINGFLLAAQNLKRFQLDQELSVEQKTFLNQSVSKFVLLALSSGIQKPVWPNFIHTKRLLKESGFDKLDTQGLRMPYKKLVPYYNRFILYFAMVAYYNEFKILIKKIIRYN